MSRKVSSVFLNQNLRLRKKLKRQQGYDMDMSVEEYLIVICVLVAVLIYNKMKNSHPSKHETKQHDDKNRDDKESS